MRSLVRVSTLWGKKTGIRYSGRSFWPEVVVLSLLLTACGSEAPKQAEQKPAAPPVPEEFQAAAEVLLGSETQVLLFGDLAKNGKQEILAANVVPNTPKSVVAGTVVTRAIVAENDNGKWVELMRADEYLKNQNGFLGLTPLQAVAGWKLQYEMSAEKGMSLYFTPVRKGENEKTLPIAVRWNPATKRYQSLDLSYEHFLGEAATLERPRATLR
ncbi:MAG TPA: hypothetical protein VEI54_09030 [Candidatus Limnocylindrales bacterium]|nr:hypothetical protein [Candidatus Limnocylindrales bacterium]